MVAREAGERIVSGADDAAVQIVFRADPTANRDKIIAALRAAGHLRTPGTVEVSREAATHIGNFMRDAKHLDPEFDQWVLDELDAALAAGADDGE